MSPTEILKKNPGEFLQIIRESTLSLEFGLGLAKGNFLYVATYIMET